MEPPDSHPRPLQLWGSVVLFAVPTLLLYVGTRYGIAALRGRLPGPDIVCWFVAGGIVFAALFVAALVAFWIEQRSVTFQGFARRFRLRRITLGDVGWSLGMLVGCGVASGAIMMAWQSVARNTTWLNEPQIEPPFIHMEPITASTSWVLLAWLPLFFFNIAGEELWWRGYILPRQERQHRSAATLVHGLGMALFHLPLGLDLTIILLPYLFGLPYVVSHRQNLWTGFIVHGLLNSGGFLAVALGLV